MTTTMGRIHSDAQLTLFSSFSLGKISKLLLRSLVRQFAGSSSVKFLFLLCTRQNKQVSFALAYASVPAHVEMMGFLGIGNNPMVGATVAIAVDIASALSK